VLKVIEVEDVGERVYSQGKFGYQSKHLLVTLGEDRSKLVENAAFKQLVCEVQVRTLLQHAWAEMEHDIQYKSDKEIPLDLKKRFSALAGLLELADREFQSIQKDSENLKEAVKTELINDLTKQGLTEKSVHTRDGTAASSQSALARDLVSQGKYMDAIHIYTKKIEAEPNSYTLFIGRAKAKFLAGDVSGSLSDLDQADQLLGRPAATELRSIIEHGDDPSTAVRALRPLNTDLAEASESLSSGDGVRAFEIYTKLDEGGYNKAFSIFGKAMCCVLEQDTVGARSFLTSLKIRPATPMSVNICAMHCILDILDGEDAATNISVLSAALKDMPTYSFAMTPLKSLFAGLKTKGFLGKIEIQEVFSAIGVHNGSSA
jgi:hypothetical protein